MGFRLLKTLFMKKLVFGLIATVLFSITGFAQGTGRVNPLEFAKLHNDYLLESVNNAMNKKLEPKEAFQLVKIPNITKDEQSKIFDYFSCKSYSQMKSEVLNSLTDAKATQYFNQIEDAINVSLNISDLNKKLDLIKVEVNKNLTKNDWDTIMVILETSEASASFWYPKEMGGSGLGTPYAYAKAGTSSKNKLLGWVRADGCGAGLGMVAWGLSGLFVAGPVGGLAGFVYGAVSGAVGSSMTAHINWND